MSYLDDNARTGRIILPDLVRAFALCGIALVNVGFIAYPGEMTYHAGGLRNGLDHAAYFGVNSLFFFKSYTLFSFMFGVGLAYQMMSADRRAAAFGPIYMRRMFGLVLLGIAHVTLAFVGDILIIYGVLGMLLFLFRNATQSSLFRVGLAFVVVQVLIALFFAGGLFMGETYAPEDMTQVAVEIQTSMDEAQAIYSNGSFADVAARRWYDWVGYIMFAQPLQAPGVFGFFLLGLAAVRAGVLDDASAPLWAKARKFYLPLGLTLSVLGSYLYMSSASPMSSAGMLAYAVILLAAPFSSLGYIGLLAKWSQGPVTGLKAFCARTGTASLSAYLLQSAILSFIFSGYGLGLYRELGAFACVCIALATAVFTLIFSSLWRTRFKRGPMEFLLRGWTYLGFR